MNPEYPTFEQYIDIIDDQRKCADMFNEFNIGKYKYANKTLYGFDMTDNTTMLWSEITSDVIIYNMSTFFDMILRQYIFKSTTSQDNIIKLTKLTKKMINERNLCSVYKFFIAIIRDDEFYLSLNRTLPDSLPISNGNIINLKDGSVRPITKVDNFTYKCNVKYTKNRSSELMEILNSISCNDQEHLKYLQKILGYCLTGHINGRVYFIFYGKGANGKSVLLNTLNEILNEQYQSVSKCVFINCGNGKSGGCEVLQLKDCRVATFSETACNEELNESIIKMISGNDKITARGLYKDPVSFTPICKLILCTNHKPDFNANDKANVDRVRLVPFNARFVETPIKSNEFKRIDAIDKIIKNKYIDEFFSWCVDGAIEYYKNPIFTPTGEILEAQNEYIREQSNISNFIDDTYTDGTDEDIILKNEIKNHYDTWCKENSVKPMKSGILFGALDDKYGKSYKSKTRDIYRDKIVYVGFKLKTIYDMDTTKDNDNVIVDNNKKKRSQSICDLDHGIDL